jgi:hypothetical protein
MSRALTPEQKQALADRFAKGKAKREQAQEELNTETKEAPQATEADYEKLMAAEEAKRMADMIKTMMSNPIAFLQAMGNQNQGPAVIVRKEKCHRHPDIDVKPGDNCPECLIQIRQDEIRSLNINFVLPCPKCGDKTKFQNGGLIKILPKKPGHYGCGLCKITYNTSGEVTEWGQKDEDFYK